MPSLPSRQMLHEVRRIHIRTRHLVSDALLGVYRSAFRGRGMEFEEVREFQAGDELRHIDWNVTARMNTPFVKTYREERSLTIMLIVDVSSSARFGSGQRTKKTLMAEIGALLALSAIANQDKIGLLLFSGDVQKYLPPGKGQRHALRVIRELLTAEAQQPGTDLTQALTFLGRLHAKPAVSFILSDFLFESDHSHALKLASKRYDCIAVRVLDPRELILPKLALVTFKDLESGQEVLVDSSQQAFQENFQQRVQQRLQHQQELFKRLGIGLIDLRTNMSYTDAIRQFFRDRAMRHR
jgi:uncharacterized protein (DUF58 family)